MAIMKSRIPPAILKSETEIPSRAKIHFPAPINPMLTKKAVRTDCPITLLRSECPISTVSERKIGRIPKVSNATKRGIKGRRISTEVSCFKRLSNPPMVTGYKKEGDSTRAFLYPIPDSGKNPGE
jgi:hypothetical protein